LEKGSAEEPVNAQVTSVAALIDEVKAAASLEAGSTGCQFTVSPVADGLAVKVDRDLLASAPGNMLQNAFKFTQPGTTVLLTAHEGGRHIRLKVQDHCGGLPPGNHEELFLPFGVTRP
jgi:signal transduction histidine kinase